MWLQTHPARARRAALVSLKLDNFGFAAAPSIGPLRTHHRTGSLVRGEPPSYCRPIPPGIVRGSAPTPHRPTVARRPSASDLSQRTGCGTPREAHPGVELRSTEGYLPREKTMPLVAVVAAPGRRRRRLAAPLDSSFALRSIGVSGVVLWLFFTVYLHNVLDVRRHSGIGVRPPSSRPATPAAAARREVREGSSVAHVREKLLSLEKGAALAAKGGFRPVVEPEPVEQSPPKRQEQHQQAVNNTEGPPPVPSNTEEGISACLLVNDENPRLPEWIAYHYLTLPLRALIVTVDPASRSNPNEIVINWWKEMGLHVNVWSEKRFLHPKMRGPCPEPDDPEKCLWHHRDRQQYFIMRCMSEFKKMNKTWVLLTDVDEYVVMNRVAADDPPVPLDEPPEGVPVMPDWRFHNAANVGSIKMGVIDGTINGLKAEPRFVDMTSDPNETFAYGTVVTDVNNHRFFLRDDVAYQESTAMVRAPPGVPTLKEPWFGLPRSKCTLASTTTRTTIKRTGRS